MSARLVYEGIAYRQSPTDEAPWLVSFVAPAEELLSWAGIPRRSEHNVTGFQRGEDPDRVRRAKEYFDLPGNQSPTALVIGIPPETPGASRQVSLEFLDGDERATVRRCRLTVEFDPDALTLADAVESLRRQLVARLGEEAEAHKGFPTNGEAGAIISEETETDEEEERLEAEEELRELEIDEEGEGPEVDSVPDEIELGRSVLRRLVDRLDDADWVKDPERSQAILDLAKPATIIDGQHRVRGAEQCERGIPFAVCAIFDCPWPEQVFQFTVINYTARGIPDQFITANASLSLTRDELGILETRLIQAKVKVIEYVLMQVVNFDKESPFYELVDLGERRTMGKIGYRTMVLVARDWYDAKHQVFSLILPNIYPDIKGKGAKTARRERWKEGDWGEFFVEFWAAVRRKYEGQPSDEAGHTLWEVGHSQLMNAVVLLQLQRAFLDNLNLQDESYFDISTETDRLAAMRKKVGERADRFLNSFPTEFFATKWRLTSLNTGPGRRALEEAFAQMVTKKGKYQYGKSALVTGQID